eukprot:454392-Rhodomonas_salina.1
MPLTRHYLAFKDSTASTAFSITDPVTVEMLVIAGGGAGGGGYSGGGGGAGSLFHAHNIVLGPGTYTVKVGKGGQPTLGCAAGSTAQN